MNSLNDDYMINLIENCRQNSPKSQKEFYKLQRPFVKSIIIRYVKNSQDQEDLIQSSMMKILTGLLYYNSDQPLGAWIGTIVRNNCIDLLRLKKRQKRVQLVELAEGMEFILHNFEEDEDISRPEVSLIKIFNLLKPDQRKILELRYEKDLTYDEICNELKITMTSAKTRIFRAKEDLRKYLRSENLETIEKLFSKDI